MTKDLGLKTSDLGLTSDIGLRTIAEVGSLVSGVSGAGDKSSEVLSPKSTSIVAIEEAGAAGNGII